MNCQFNKSISPLRMLCVLSLTIFLTLCTSWAFNQLLQPAEATQVAEGKLFINTQNPLHRVRIAPAGWESTTDAGHSWTSLPSPFAENAAVRLSFHPQQNSHMFAASSDGHSAYYDGSSWWPISLPGDSTLTTSTAPPVLVQSLPSATRLLFGSPRGLLFTDLPDDAAATALNHPVDWQAADLPSLPVTSLALAASGERIATGFASGLVALLDHDAVSAFSLVSAAVPHSSAVHSLAFHPANSDDLLATFVGSPEPANPASGPVFHSLDAGQAWVAVPLPPSARAEQFALRLASPGGVDSLLASVDGIIAVTEQDLLLAAQNETPLPNRVSAVTCRFTITPSTQSIDFQAKRLRFKVDANSSTCAWRISSINPTTFVKVVKGEGRGDGEILLDLLENPSTNSREARISAANQQLTIRQAGRPAPPPPPTTPTTPTNPGGGGGGGVTPPCSVTSAGPLSLPAAGGTVTIAVTLTPLCGNGVRLQSSAPFLVVPATTVTQATFTLTVPPNTVTQERRATISLTGANNAVVQNGQINLLQSAAVPPPAPCQLTLNSSVTTFPAAGGTANLTVTANGICAGPLTIESDATFVTPRYPAGFETALGIQVAPNTSPSSLSARVLVRQGTAVSNQVNITQAGQTAPPPPSCIFNFSRQIDVSASQSEAILAVTASGPSCTWSVGAFSTLAPEKTWAGVPAGTYTGSRQLRILLSPGPQQTRIGFFTVAGQTITLRQRGGLPENSSCSSINGPAVSVRLPGNNPASSAGEERRLEINAASGCVYSISLFGTTGMVQTLDPLEGVSNGILRFRLLPNTTGVTRSVSFSITHIGSTRSPITLQQRN